MAFLRASAAVPEENFTAKLTAIDLKNVAARWCSLSNRLKTKERSISYNSTGTANQREGYRKNDGRDISLGHSSEDRNIFVEH